MMQLYRGGPQGNRVHSLDTLTALFSGIVHSQSNQLSASARKVLDGN